VVNSKRARPMQTCANLTRKECGVDAGSSRLHEYVQQPGTRGDIGVA
jgi:hypothetical protein